MNSAAEMTGMRWRARLLAGLALAGFTLGEVRAGGSGLPKLPDRQPLPRVIQVGHSASVFEVTRSRTSSRLVLHVLTSDPRRWQFVSVLPGRPVEPLPASTAVFVLNSHDLWWNLTLGSVANVAVNSLYRSSDSGRHWRLINSNRLHGRVGSGIVPDWIQTQRVFTDRRRGWFVSAGLEDAGLRVQRTADGGSTWNASPLPLFSRTDVASRPLAFVFGKSAVVTALAFGGTRPGRPALQTFLTRDGGVSWTEQSSLTLKPGQFTDVPQQIVFRSPTDGLAVLGGVSYRTRDSGKHWRLRATGRIRN